MRDAVEMKIQLVRWLCSTIKEDEVLASELRFRGGNRADLAVIGADRLCAIEIKGPRDDFRRLAKQLQAYRELFLEVFVAVEPEDLKPLTPHLGRDVGIVVIEETVPRVTRKPLIRKSLNKESAVSWLSVSDLRELARGNIRRLPSERDELERAVCSILPRSMLTKHAIVTARAKAIPRYETFRAEMGSKVTSDDIRLLSAPTRIRKLA